MEDLEKHFENVRKALQSPEYRARIEKVMEAAKSLQQKAVVDRSRLFIPVNF